MSSQRVDVHFHAIALSAFPSTLATLKSVIGKSHMLFGSDYPYAPEMALQVASRFINHYPLLDVKAQKQIARENALGLFPRLSNLSAHKSLRVFSS